MSHRRRPRALRTFLALFLLLPAAVTLAPPAQARVPAVTLADEPAGTPRPVGPLDGERVSESSARFELLPATGARDVRVVVSRVPFDPTGWSALPTGSGWTVVPHEGSGVPLAGLGLADRTDTPLWWTVAWTDARTGRLQTGEVRSFTLVPRFANRVAADGALPPSASGRLAARSIAGSTTPAPRRPIALAAGYELVPGAALPQIPAILSRVLDPTDGGARRATFVVQFADESTDSARARVAAAGGVIAGSLGGDGYLVRLDAGARARLAAAGGQPWIADFAPAYKLSTELDVAAGGTIDATVLLFADGDVEATLAALRALGAQRVKAHPDAAHPVARFELDRARLADVAALADVAWIEPTPRDMPSNDLAQWVVQSGVTDSRPVSDRGLRGQGQVVMVTDSGIRANHEMFNDSTQAITGFGDYPTHRKIVAYKPGSDDPFVAFGDHVENSYHGTHTAGTVAGDPSPSSTAPWSGMADRAKLYFMDVAGPGSGGFYPPADLNDLFQPSYTGNAGGAARISSNSWGSSQSIARYTISSMQVDQFVWDHPDYLIAFATGNYGAFGSVQSPGTAKSALSVGATGNGAEQNRLAQFSSRGPTYDGRRKPTVCAPGHLVTSSVGNTRYGYATYSGTSMATPAVAGAMALVRQYLTEGSYPTGVPVPGNALTPSAALLKAMAVASARNDVVSYTAPDNAIGYGRLTIDDVLHFPGDALRTLLVDTEDGLFDQQYLEYQVQVTNPAQPLKIALCWSDAPGNPAAQVALVNDLDLVVTNGTKVYRGNYLLNNVSAVNGFRDSLNVEEFVRLAVPAAGLWTVRVEGRRVLHGPQPFALCITGGVGGPNGAVALDRFQYALKDTLAIEVVDADATGPLHVTVSSNTEPYPQDVILTGSHGVFRGSVPIAPAAIQLADGVVAVSSGDQVSVTYAAAASPPVVATARVNVRTPTITNVQASVLGSTRALVTWATDVAASSRVAFGPAALTSSADSLGYTTQHAVLLEGLAPNTIYRYDVESRTYQGDVSRDSLGGAHRTFETKGQAPIALVMDDPSPATLQTWQNALAALGWDAEVIPKATLDPPLVGNTSKGLRSYDAVLWQVDPDRYPPFSDAQRAAVDSLLNGGGRLLVTGHDIGYGLSDASVPSYTPEREAWLESGLKTRYYADNLAADTLSGIAGNVVSGRFIAPLYYPWGWVYPDAGDNVGAAPGNGGTWTGDWTENWLRGAHIGMHWESSGPLGTPGVGQWGGQKSRLVGLFYEWCALEAPTSANLATRTGVLEDAVGWLLGHAPPRVQLVTPTPGTIVTGDFMTIKFYAQADAGRSIASRLLESSVDDGATWNPVPTVACNDTLCIWDVGGMWGGTPTPNSTRALLRIRVTDNGAPSLNGEDLMNGVFTIARPGGDGRGPVLVAGSPAVSPLPLRGGAPATLFATFSDAETGAEGVASAEFSLGTTPAPAGTGTAMTGTFGGATAAAQAAVPTQGVVTGQQTLWLRGRDLGGNWGTAYALSVPSVAAGVVAVEEVPTVDFLGAPVPNPSRGAATLRFGLAREGGVRLELFDLAGRRVRTLVDGTRPAGTHVEAWDGRNERGTSVGAGIYFLRLVTPASTHHARVVVVR